MQAFKQYQAIASEYLCKRAGVLLKCKIISVCPLMRRLPCRRNIGQWRCRQAHRLEIAENTRAELERDQAANDEKVASFSDAVDVQKKALTKAKRGAGNARRRCVSRMVLALRAC